MYVALMDVAIYVKSNWQHHLLLVIIIIIGGVAKCRLQLTNTETIRVGRIGGSGRIGSREQRQKCRNINDE